MNPNFFLRTSLRFYSALAILESQIFVVVVQFGAENISLLSGRLVKVDELDLHWAKTEKKNKMIIYSAMLNFVFLTLKGRNLPDSIFRSVIQEQSFDKTIG